MTKTSVLIKNINHSSVYVLLLLIFFLIISLMYAPNYENQPKIMEGQLDLSEWNFRNEVPIRLRGKWEFYWNQILEPSELQTTNPSFYLVPKPWKGSVLNQSLSNLGVATYVLRIKVPEEEINYGLRVLNIRMASKVYVNGELVGERGSVSLSRDANYESKNIPYTMFFTSEGPELEIVIQVSNQYLISGGIVQDIFLGDRESIMRHYFVANMWDIFIVTAILIMAFYYVIGFMQMRRDAGQFYYFAFSIFYAFIVATGSEKIFFQVFPDISFERIISVRVVVIFLSVLAMSFFFYELDNNLIPNVVRRSFNILFTFLAIGVSFLPRDLYSRTESLMLLTIVIYYTFVCFWILYDLLKKRTKLENGDRYILLALTIAILGNLIANMFYNNATLNTSFFSVFSLLVFLILNAGLVTKRYARAYRKVEDLAQQLLRADALKDEFLMNTAHEFKAPLQGIQNITKVLLASDQKVSIHEIQKNLQHISVISYRLSNLVNDILDLEALKENRIHLESKSFDCRGVIQIVIEVLRLQAEEKEIELINHIPLHSIYGYGDVNRVKQIMYNLIGNAIQFTSNGCIIVDAVIEDNEVLITVTDDGIGIASENQQRIFEGLGLSISLKLAQAMNGDVKLISSILQKGSSFGLFLPKAVSNDEREKNRFISIGEAEDYEDIPLHKKSAHDKDTYSILLIEQDASEVHIIREGLKGEEYQIFTAFSGEKAIEYLKEGKKIDLVLLDVLLFDLSGYELCERIREIYPLHELPILLFTSKNTPDEVRRGFMAGANDFLVKPYDLVELKAKIGIHYALKNSMNKAIQAEIKFLQGQIKPHFIYNALSVITSLCYIDGERAGRLLSEFSNYLRLTFDVDYNDQEITLEKEVSLIKSYIEIEKARFAERVNVVFDVDEEVLECRVLPLLVQPLVENAIRYGILKRITGGQVTFTARHEEGKLMIRVEDDGIGMSKEKMQQIFSDEANESGVALKNIRRRMLETYGGGFEVESEENRGTRFTIKIPYRL